jgi:hypothetical protein
MAKQGRKVFFDIEIQALKAAIALPLATSLNSQSTKPFIFESTTPLT